MDVPVTRTRMAPVHSPVARPDVRRPGSAPGSGTRAPTSARPSPSPPPPSVVMAAAHVASAAGPPTHTASAELSSSAAAVLRHPLLRDLVRENEGMLAALAELRGTEQRWSAAQLRFAVLEEAAARATVAMAEAVARSTCATRAHVSVAARVQQLEGQLREEEREAAELRRFAELAQAQLEANPRRQARVQVSGPERYAVAASPTHRSSGAVDTDGEADSRRTSLEEITNARGAGKRLRSVESSDGGGSQKSPDALTKVRKTLRQ